VISSGGGGSVLPVSNIFLAGDRTLVIQRSKQRGEEGEMEKNNPLVTSVITGLGWR